ncbi:T9SS type A sorting domain-containing protein [Aequorivita sp. CIP111184]|uniref:T9SS type A sorting domain-containing protein n=1 Tax=Aequorivita sp. CIP111184 TaxID=2211356 RepID=UPI000DD0354E|nr:T9SS type A sorting domain-containing protein [Aequorivita sp. CIP111184]
MKKITMLILLMLCAIGYSQTDAKSMGVSSPVTVKTQQNKSQAVQQPQKGSSATDLGDSNSRARNTNVQYQPTAIAPVAYFRNNAAPMGEVVEGMSSTTFNPNLRIPLTGNYGYPANNAVAALVYDNGPHYNIAGPPPVSMLQDTSLGMSLFGFGCQFINSNSIADDVILTADYDINSVDVYAYQTGSVPPSVNALYMQVWDGDPSGGGASVIWGDLTTNIMSNVASSTAFRQLESVPGGTTREIQIVTANTTGLSLTAGTYWIEYTFAGSGASGPWAPPIVITGNATTGNAMQNLAGVWGPAIDAGSGTPQGMPFQMYGDPIGGGGGACGSPILEVNQDSTDTCMANITQTDLAQSYIPIEPIAAGAGIMFDVASTGLDVDLSLWDGLPNAGGTMLASGTSQTDGTVWTDVFWDPVVNVTVGNTYYIVIDGDPLLPCVAGDTSDPYPGGNVFANAGYNSFPGFDYTFRTYSCDASGGGCPIVSDCNLSDVTPDDASSPNVWDRPFADGTCCSGLGPVSYDVYGPFTVDVTGLYTIDSDQDSGAWDGYIFLYETCFDPLDQTTNYIAGDDDGPAGIGTSQILDVNLTAGTEYYFITTGFSAGDFGAFTTTITGVGTASCGGPVVTYDDCSGAIAVACGDSVVGETLTATDSGGNAAPDVFYKFTGTGSPQLVTISLCAATDYDSVLRVFDDCDLLNELAFNDDFCGLQSEVTFQSDGISTYYIMVEGFGSNSGNFSLDVTCTEPLPNDGCEGAIAVNCGDSVTGTTVGSTIDTAPTCGTPITSPGVWYTLDDNSGLPGDITLSLCNGTDFDSKISVYSGSCTALVCVDGNDDACGLQSEISFASDGNTKFYILIHSFGGATGNFTLDVTCTPTPPPNDRIVNSIDVDEIGFPYTDPAVAMPAATTENGSPVNCDLTGANGVWYNFVSAGNGTANAMIVTPGGASSVTFYTAPNENAVETDLTLVPQQTNQCLPGTSASIFTLAGQAYYVFVLNSGAVTDIMIDGTNLDTSENSIAGFSYYPNPTTGVLNLSSVDNIERVSIYNLLGQMVIDSRVDATTSQMDVSALSTGSYLMKVTINGQTGTYKVMKD